MKPFNLFFKTKKKKIIPYFHYCLKTRDYPFLNSPPSSYSSSTGQREVVRSPLLSLSTTLRRCGWGFRCVIEHVSDVAWWRSVQHGGNARCAGEAQCWLQLKGGLLRGFFFEVV
ncbi:hypothetical protein ES332_A07G122400v1 [Gossypium tomentosum]|uniref:Uncharacterized protein n=1 Tax=Gossypium tomentosum TaxID=34277 RepID=A0A5D2PS59_GOSTO|nr:hypothetical protein ES332_A07G122400v1 [Gossypium tomentosum]